MKRLLLPFLTLFLVLSAFSQNTSPLVYKDFMQKSNELIDMEQIPKRSWTDFDSNPICRIKVKAVGFEEDLMQKFIFVPNGIEITHMVFKNGQWLLHISSRKNGELTIKYMGDYVFRLPYQLEAGKVYELTLGMETATLVINAIPTTAEIFIDGKKVGTGYGSAAVSVGSEHRYKVVCEDYIPEEDMIKTDKTEKIEKLVELKPNFGYVTIKTEPSGADIFIDEVKTGVTPYQMKKIKPGTHVVELRKTGYENFAEMITIKTGEVNKSLENVNLVKDKSVVEPVISQKPDNQTYSNQTPKNQTVPAAMTIQAGKGVFSIDANTKVQFSKGNLQYQPSTNTWRFAEHQWDIIGKDNGNISPSYSGWIDLFGYGTGDDPTKTSDENSDYKDFNDWGNNLPDEDGRSWYTLSGDEWTYLFDERITRFAMRFVKATVNGVKGVILFPDDWDPGKFFLKNVNSYEASFSDNKVSQVSWNEKLEANGAVFLPSAGMRRGTSIKYVGYDGHYWSSTSVSGTGAYYMFFTEGNIMPATWYVRKNGRSVRLVRFVK